MSDYSEEGPPPEEKRLRKAEDFRDTVKDRDREEVRRELGVPDVDEILKDLQRKHGIRISLSPKMVERLEAVKQDTGPGDYDATSVSGCIETDVCILCDHGDICSTCDTMDWCIWNDTHLVEAR